eukprot:SAG11_NODE_17_length_26125_cov_45.892723_9_plen_153_part_00
MATILESLGSYQAQIVEHFRRAIPDISTPSLLHKDFEKVCCPHRHLGEMQERRETARALCFKAARVTLSSLPPERRGKFRYQYAAVHNSSLFDQQAHHIADKVSPHGASRPSIHRDRVRRAGAATARPQALHALVVPRPLRIVGVPALALVD